MSSFRHVRSRALLPLVLAGLLGVLAAVQYSWLGRLSDAERERLRSSLEARADQFTVDVDREVTRSYLLLQVDYDSVERRDWSAFAARWDRWKATAAHPGLVAAVYLSETLDGVPALSRFDPPSRGFVPAEWPEGLAGVRSEAEGERGVSAQGLAGGWTMTPSGVPVLVAPLLGVRFVRNETSAIITTPSPGVRGQVIIEFDAAYVRDVFLPSLAREHFAAGGAFDYHVSITARTIPGASLLTSGRLPSGAARSAPDLARSLFEVRPADLEALRLEGLMERSQGGDPPRAGRIVVSFLRLKTAEGASAIEGGLWEVSLWHRAGSLEAAVSSARRRNLAVSGAILLLLAAALALVVLSAERARRLAAQQMEFVAGVSHELRTPLAVIRSAAENLADGVVDEGGKVRRYGGLIAAEGKKLSEMVEQVMAFAGLEAGRAVRRDPVDVAEVVDRAVAGCQELRETPGLRVERDIEGGLLPVWGDDEALVRAVRNVVANAARHGAAGGWVRISAKAGTEAGRQVVLLRVEDGGPGIEPAEREKIFEPFYRGRTAVEGQVHGSGLGLSLVRRVADTHGGRVTVDTAPGCGAAFTLHLPATPVSREPAPAPGDAKARS